MASSTRRTSYQKLLEEEHGDPRVQQEIAQRKRVGHYQVKCTLGSGNFSKVKLALHLLTKEMVAMKVIDKSQLDSTSRRVLSREITCMERLSHVNIIRLFEVIETFSHHYLIMEYAPEGDLDMRVKRDGPFNEKSGKVVYRQIALAVDYMHQNDVIHRDIKAENIFFSHGDHIKIGDFGFSTPSLPGSHLKTFCGSPPYAAPELLKEQSYNGVAIDCWAMGVLLYFMMTGNHPFEGENLSSIKEKVTIGNYPLPTLLSENCRQLVRGLLRLTPSDRLTPKRILKSDWLLDSELVNGEIESVNSSLSLDNSLNSLDLEILEIMKDDYGIPTQNTSSMLGEPRNDIAGTYRILHNRKVSLSQPRGSMQNHVRGLEQNDSGRRGPGQLQRQQKSKICIIL